MPNRPDFDLVTYLNGKTGAASGVTLTSATNLFQGPVQPSNSAAGMPAQAVFVANSGGPPALPYMGQSVDDRQSAVQVRVRGNPGDYDGGDKLARDVWQLVQRASISGYTYSLCRQSEPVYIDQDEQGCHEWSINAILRWVG